MIAIEALRLKIATLESMLETEDPGYKLHLAEIHSTLRGDPEMVHILDPERDLQPIFEAIRRFKNIEIPITEKKAGSRIVPKGPINLDQF